VPQGVSIIPDLGCRNRGLGAVRRRGIVRIDLICPRDPAQQHRRQTGRRLIERPQRLFVAQPRVGTPPELVERTCLVHQRTNRRLVLGRIDETEVGGASAETLR
jgi:hypothetical protein